MMTGNYQQVYNAPIGPTQNFNQQPDGSLMAGLPSASAGLFGLGNEQIGGIIGGLGGAALGGFLGSQGGASSFGGLDPRFQSQQQTAVNMAASGAQTPFYAGSNPMLDAGIQQTNNVGLAASDLGLRTLGGEFADINNNQYAQNAIDASTSQVSRNFLERTLPSLESAAIQQGAYGGSRNGIVNMLAAERANMQAQENAAEIANQFYNQERQLMNDPTLAVTGAGQQVQAGGLQQGLDQRALDDERMRAQYLAQILSQPAFQIRESEGDSLSGILQGATALGGLGTALGGTIGGLF